VSNAARETELAERIGLHRHDASRGGHPITRIGDPVKGRLTIREDEPEPRGWGGTAQDTVMVAAAATENDVGGEKWILR
jgi:hypothetical protein